VGPGGVICPDCRTAIEAANRALTEERQSPCALGRINARRRAAHRSPARLEGLHDGSAGRGDAPYLVAGEQRTGGWEDPGQVALAAT
jgi:hypothetical protein